MCDNLGLVADARRVFDEMATTSVVLGNTMVACYVRSGDM
jgi:Na+/H+-dicarboxylate symporter